MTNDITTVHVLSYTDEPLHPDATPVVVEAFVDLDVALRTLKERREADSFHVRSWELQEVDLNTDKDV